MNEYQEIYEEYNNQENRSPQGYRYPSYHVVQEYYNEFPTGYENSRYTSKEMNEVKPYNNIQRHEHTEEYNNYYYKDYSQPYYDNQEKNKKRFYTPDRINNGNLYLNEQLNSRNASGDKYLNLREDYSNPSSSRVNIRKKVFRGSLTPQPYNENINQDEEFVDNYQYHETTNIKDKGNKKYDSITHIVGYSNLIPLNRMKYLYDNNYSYEGKYKKENKNYNNYQSRQENEDKFKNAIKKVQELQRGKREYDDFIKKLNSNNEQNLNEDAYREEYRNEINRKNNNYRNENLRRNQNYPIENIRENNIRNNNYTSGNERNENYRIERYKTTTTNYRTKNYNINDNYTIDNRKYNIPHGKYIYKKNISGDIDYYRNYTNIEGNNIKKHEIEHKDNKDKITKNYNKIPYRSNINYNVYDNNRNYSSTNIKYSKNYSKNNINNDNDRVNDYKYNNKNNNYNSSYKTRTTRTSRTTTNIVNDNKDRINNSYRINNKNNQANNYKYNSTYISKYSKNNYNSNSSNTNNNKNKLISVLKVEEKTASLNFPNPHKKVDTYGDNFDAEKYRREYTNIEDVDNGRIENHVETTLSKDGQYLISVSSATKVYDEKENNNNDNENYERREEEIEEENVNNEYEPPERNVEEIVSTITTKRKNLGDNYKYYESKNLHKPNLTSYTAHKRRGERTIYGNEEYETKEIKRYKLGPDGTPDREEVEYIVGGEEDDQIYNNNDYGKGEGEGEYDEENYHQEEFYYQ